MRPISEITYPALDPSEACVLEGRWKREAEKVGLRRPILVGDCPARGRFGWPALHGGRAMERLSSIIGIPLPHLLAMTERVNVFDDFGRWKVADARASVWNIIDEGILRDDNLHLELHFIALGARVEDAFSGNYRWGFLPQPLFKTVDREFFHLTVIPHPSGKCITWNSKVVRQDAREFFSNLLEPYKVLISGEISQ